MPDQKLLLISYLFPPAGGIPVQRALSLARFFPECGYDVHVLSCSNPGVPNMDPSLLARVPASVVLHRAISPELPFAVRSRIWSLLAPKDGAKKALKSSVPSKPQQAKTHNGNGGGGSAIKRGIQGLMRRIFNPDPEALWVPFALRKARKIVRREKIDTVLITMPPYSSILIGLRLKEEFPHLKLVADFRDEWLDYYLNAFPFYRSEHIRRNAVRIERETAEKADLIVALTSPIHKQMRERYADLPQEKFVLVENGFDPLALGGFRSRSHGTDKIVVGYAGTMHNTSSPKAYFDALDRFPEALREQMETRVMGRVTDEQAPNLAGRKTAIHVKGFVPQDEAFRNLEEVDFLLLVQHHAPSLPGKFFEYMAMGKPILAITSDEGEVARVIRETGVGWSADPSKPDNVLQMLRHAVEGFRSGSLGLHRDQAAIDKYSRRTLTQKYAALIRQAGAAQKRPQQQVQETVS